MSDSNTEKVITRFAPSPTGFLHLGNYRTALFCYLIARQSGGEFLLRIEDTDKARSKDEYAKDIIESLEWMKIIPDNFNNIVYQSQNLKRHQEIIKKLIAENKAYVSKEIPKEPGQRDSVIRFKNPNKKISFEDLIRGTIEMDTSDLGDFIIARSIEEPVFHLAVVVDDFDMGITHIIRGEDHISNTPRHILIQEAISAPTPIYAHVPLVLSPDKSKLSKRNGAISIKNCRDDGYLADAVINCLPLIGWNPGTDKEIWSINELIETFDLSRVQKSGAIFNIKKLNWLNREYIKRLSDNEIMKQLKFRLPEELKNNPNISKLVPIIKERIDKFGDINKLYETGELDFYFKKPLIDKDNLLCPEKLRKGSVANLSDVKKYLEKTLEIISGIDENDFSVEKIKSSVWDFATEAGRGIVLWAYRYALSGKEKSPDPFVLSEFFGKQETLNRVKLAIDLIK